MGAVQSGWAGGDAMTPSLCSALCTGFKFFGVQFGYNCFCGDDYGNQGGKAPESDCGSPCTGDSSIMCGGSSRNSIYAQPTSDTIVLDRVEEQSCDSKKCPPQHVGVDFVGYDLVTPCGGLKDFADVGSFEECCGYCQGEPSCGSFTWNQSANTCHLKTADGPRGATGSDDAISGNMAEAPGRAGPALGHMQNDNGKAAALQV
eukprot:gnl/TRDRNA2_/TRDRNA2_106637_c0_seq1.p1 gnl/TRDRNA2_/TRDRNA2_106637_c0~~gnl/TRDRNA2_/TRDRNA2_106637_c0_seq1.p1  ORF type:complete len:203 (+),score=38.69 gnl/TRDRNA2_/TRDRNA2_106637_c0_seq1:350-958(+)